MARKSKAPKKLAVADRVPEKLPEPPPPVKAPVAKAPAVPPPPVKPPYVKAPSTLGRTPDPKKAPTPKGTVAKAKAAVVHAAGKVAEAVTHAAEAARDHVIEPVAEAVGLVRKKPPAREPKRVVPVKATPAEPRKKTMASSMMVKNLSLLPDEKPARGNKPQKGKL